MLEIKKELKDKYIEYHFNGTIRKNDLSRVETMIIEDIAYTYTMIFNFTHLDYLSAEAANMLKEVYVLSVKYACTVLLSGINAETAMMLEIFQLDTLYPVIDSGDIFDGDGHESIYYA